jgi:hypothetical protein
MSNTKLFELSSSLSDTDWSDLITFAGLGINRLPPQDLEAMNIIKAEISTETDDQKKEEAMDEKIFRQLLSDVPESKKKAQLNHIKSRLSKAIQRYIALQELDKEDWVKELLLLKYFESRGLTKNYNSLLNSMQRALEKGKHDFDIEYQKYKLQEFILSHQYEERKKNEDLARMETALDNYYLENKIRMMVEQYNRHRIRNEGPPEEGFPEWVNLADLGKQGIGPRLLQAIYSMLSMPEEKKYYHEVKTLFQKHAQEFSDEYKQTVCEYMLNQCIYYVHRGERKFAAEYTEHIRYIIDHKLFTSSNGLAISKYMNTISMALISDDLDWLEKFVNTYSARVDHPHIDSIENLYQASILFHRGEYRKALGLLPTFDYFQFYFKIIYDKLCIKLYYELKDELLEPKLNAFEIYLKRKDELPDERREQNLNFVKAVRNLGSGNGQTVLLAPDQYVLLDYIWLEEKEKRGRD